ncbi:MULTISPECIES: alpha/beta fold hydrolase [Streptomyces]|uniref:alpha/beta fold hydrolase n=1 Tax=Streptomyces TaxID=1883 RepID=UPI0029A0646B|nr:MULTISPECIES: alpha/beta fold hydrolase [Streptomyces]MDX3639099.1 alpha/beta fold hydrolase [Streptomyces sp. MB09-02B]MDX3732665.1 alpha/beta fold hydrolase [Streptomyces caniscabiei]
MSARHTPRGAVIGPRSGDGAGRADRLVLGALAATAAGIAVRELIGPDSRNFPPGRLVQVDGRPTHVMESKGSQAPTVVFESGLGNPATMWYWLFDHLPSECRLVAYDRPGIGWSQPAKGARDSARHPDQLLSLLKAAGAPPPYLLVGHSLGGLLVRLFAERHPELTAGLVLVDATHPAELSGSAFHHGLGSTFRRLDRWIARAALGLTADAGVTAELLSMPPALVAPTVKAMTRLGSLRAARRELALSREWAAACDRADLPASWPVAIVSAATGLEYTPGFAEYQRDLALLSDVTRSYSVAKATHNSLLVDRDHAETVAEAIVWALDRVPRDPGPDPGPDRGGSPASTVSRDGSASA